MYIDPILSFQVYCRICHEHCVRSRCFKPSEWKVKKLYFL